MRLFCVFKDSKEKATSSTKQSSVSPPLGSLAIPLALACLPGRELVTPSLFHVHEHGLADGGLSDFPVA